MSASIGVITIRNADSTNAFIKTKNRKVAGLIAQEFSKKFYNSKGWKRCRDAYIKRVNGLCETCLSNGIIRLGHIVHHTEKLTPANINNPDITLNHNKLRYDCLECHNAEIEEHGGKLKEQRYKFDKEGNIIPVLPPEN